MIHLNRNRGQETLLWGILVMFGVEVASDCIGDVAQLQHVPLQFA